VLFKIKWHTFLTLLYYLAKESTAICV
jgi:hypothetical protein